MSSLHSLYNKLESLMSMDEPQSPDGQDQLSSSTSSGQSVKPDSNQQILTTPNLKLAYTTLQSLAKELKPTIDTFFDAFINDGVPTSTLDGAQKISDDDEEKLRAMNEKLDVFLAFCPGIRGAYEYLLEKEKRRGDGDSDGEIADADDDTDKRRGG